MRCQVCNKPITLATVYATDGDHHYCDRMCYTLRLTQERIDYEGDTVCPGRRTVGIGNRKKTTITEFKTPFKNCEELGTLNNRRDSNKRGMDE